MASTSYYDPNNSTPKVAPKTSDLIREYREKNGWTRKQLAQMVNVKVEVINELENGVANKKPEQKNIRNLEKLFGVKLTGQNMGCKIDHKGAIIKEDPQT